MAWLMGRSIPEMRKAFASRARLSPGNRQAIGRIVPEVEVLDNRELGKNAQLLVNRCDTLAGSSNRVTRLERSAEHTTWPVSGRMAPAIIPKRVDLPAPFAPTSPTISPSPKLTETRRTAYIPPKRLVRS